MAGQYRGLLKGSKAGLEPGEPVDGLCMSEEAAVALGLVDPPDREDPAPLTKKERDAAHWKRKQAGESAPLGRRPVEIDWPRAEAAAFVRASWPQISASVGVSPGTLKRAIQREFQIEPRDWREHFRAIGETALRFEQWKSVKAGSTRMQIHLGQSWLGQSPVRRAPYEDGDGKISETVIYELPWNQRAPKPENLIEAEAISEPEPIASNH